MNDSTSTPTCVRFYFIHDLGLLIGLIGIKFVMGVLPVDLSRFFIFI